MPQTALVGRTDSASLWASVAGEAASIPDGRLRRFEGVFASSMIVSGCHVPRRSPGCGSRTRSRNRSVQAPNAA